MSRGLGKTQKKVLRLLGTCKWKSIDELKKKFHGKYDDSNYGYYPDNAYMAIYRAIKTLEKRNLVETKKFGITTQGFLSGKGWRIVLKARKVKR